MPTPSADIEAVAAAHARLHETLAGLTDEQARAACLLPDWTVGHLVTHLARNADSVTRRVNGAVAGELLTQYEGGRDGRARDIEAGAGRSAADLLDDLRAADDRLDALLASAPATVWDGRLLAGGGDEVPAAEVVFHRLREVEVHHVDLGMGYSHADWPELLVHRWLPDLLRELPSRTEPHALLAWLLRRADAPALGAWH